MSGSSDASFRGDTEQCSDAGMTAADLDLSTVQQEPSQRFFFYQSSSGQPIFQHAHNAQMLIKQYGCPEKYPETKLAEILESTIMTEELIDRWRYTRHLPVALSFEEDDAVSKADCVQGEVRGA